MYSFIEINLRTMVKVMMMQEFIFSLIALVGLSDGTISNSTISFFFTSDPQFGWGNSYSGNEERALQTMIDLGRITALCTDCPQVIPIAGDLTMDGMKRHIYRYGYMAAEFYGPKVLDGLGNHDILKFRDDEVSFENVSRLRVGSGENGKGWILSEYWNTRMSRDNGENSYYTIHQDAQYYTIAVKQRWAPATSPYVAYIIQLHNCIYSESAVRYLRREKDRLERDNEDMKPLILVAHQFCGNALASFNETVRQLRVALIIHGHYHCDQQHDRDHCDFRDNQPSLLLDRFGADFTNMYEAVIPRVTSNAAFHNIFWSVTLDPIHGKVKLKRYDNHHVARNPRSWRFTDDSTSSSHTTVDNNSREFQFSLARFRSPSVQPLFARSHITLRRLHMWPASFQALVEAQFNVNGFNLPYHDARALECTYTEQNNRCVDNYRLRYL